MGGVINNRASLITCMWEETFHFIIQNVGKLSKVFVAGGCT